MSQTITPFPLSPSIEIRPSAKAEADGLKQVKLLIWSYFWLLIFEGALRKWVLPSMANPLLVVRDPVLLAIFALGFARNLFPTNLLVLVTGVLAAITTLISVATTEGNMIITLFGLRTNFLHLPLIFLLPRVFNRTDVERVGRWLLLLSFPMALLVIGQFRGGPDSWLNVGVGGNINGQIDVGFDKIRPPGTFSFNTGLYSYLGLTIAFLLNILMLKEHPLRKLALGAMPAVAVMAALSGSRSTLGIICIILVGVLFICVYRPRFFGRSLQGFLVIGAAYLILSAWSEFRTGLMVHETRFTSSGGLMDGLLLRILGDLEAPFKAAQRTTFWGLGLGMGTNFASGVLYGERLFLIAEGEWDRVVCESGPLLGFAYIGLRISLILAVLGKAFRALRDNDPLPFLILLSVAPSMLNGQFGVPTTLGFAVFGAGLALAATQIPAEEEEIAAPVITPKRIEKKKVRGRSIYAEQLHG